MTKKQQNDWDEIKQIIFAVTKSQDRTDKQLVKLEESQSRLSAKTDAQIFKLGKNIAKLEKNLDAVGKQLGDIGLVQGEIAEDLFYRNVSTLFADRQKYFNNVKRNLRKTNKAEFDIVAVNGKEVLVIEVKNKLSARMVDSFVNKRLPKFKEFFPEYANYQIIGGMGALVVKDDVEQYAERAGLYVLTQANDGTGATIINDADFKEKVF